MKKLFVVVAMLCVSFASYAQVEGNDTVKTDTVTTSTTTEQPATATNDNELPQVIKDSIAKSYPDATISSFTKDDQDGQAVYSVKICTKDNTVFTEKYNDKGEVIGRDFAEEWMKDSRAILIQDTYDEDRLLNFANEKIKHLQFVNWDDFYEKMSREFVYEDAEEESPR